MSRRHLAAAAVLASLLAMPAVAEANLYCVNEPACVSAGGTEEGTDGTALQKAFAAAAGHLNSGGADRVLIGAGRYTRAGGLEYNGDEVAIRGAGEGATVITAPTTPGTILNLQTSPGTVSDLSVEIPTSVGFTGINSNAAALSRVSVTSVPSAEGPTGLKTDGGSFSNGTVEVPTGTGVIILAGELLDSTISGVRGVDGTVLAPLAIRRCRISGLDGIELFDGSPTIEDTLVDLGGGAGVGVEVAANKASGTATLRHLTIVNGAASSSGLAVRGVGAHAAATIADSVIAGVGKPIVAIAVKAAGASTVTAGYSSFEAAKDLALKEEGAATPPLPTVESPVSATPAFVSPVFGALGFADGNWRLRADSALLDAGTPGALGAGESSTDLDGNARLVNGRRDVGAYEYRRRGPIVNASAGATSATVGQPVSFSGSAEVPEAGAGDTITSYTWSFDDGATASGASVGHAFTVAGEHTATLTATDLLGVTGAAVAVAGGGRDTASARFRVIR